MVPSSSFHVIFLVINILCDSVGGSRIYLGYKLSLLVGKADTPAGFRTPMLRDLIDPIANQKGVRGGAYWHLQILYDKVFEDDISSLADYTKERSGIVSYFLDKTEDQLRILLGPVDGPSVLLLLCSPRNLIFIFQLIRYSRLESHHVRWVLIVDEEDLRRVISGLEGLVFEGTHVTVGVRDGRGSYDKFSSYVDDNGIVRFSNELDDHDDPASSMDMRGRNMRVAAVTNFGMCNLRPLPDGSIGPSTGVDITLIENLSRALNFTYRIVSPQDGTYGNPLLNGTVTGMIGMVVRREAELATCSISLSSLRETVVDFPYPFYRAPLALFSRSPKQKDRVMAIFSPFTFQVWSCLVAIVLIVGPIAALLSRLSCDCHRVEAKVDLQSYSFNFFRSLVVQGNLLLAITWSQRLVFYAWYLFCLVVSAMYSGMLIAVLTVPGYETPIDFLQDLPRAVQSGFDIGVLADSANALLFKDAESGIYAETWKLFNHKNPERSFIKRDVFGVEKVLQRDFIYIGYLESCEIIATKLGRNKIHIGKETFYSGDTGIASPPGAPYIKTISKVILKLIEGGFRSKWKADELRRVTSSMAREGQGSEGTRVISINHLQAAFFIVVIGFLVAAAVLLLERIFFYHQVYIIDGQIG